ncbi:MAG: DUF2723 domain-containing protein [Anaerolineae bacterium]|jgi:hypothetical protein
MPSAAPGSGQSDRRLRVLPPALLFLAIFALYAATAAPGTLFGDPSEYQFIPAILGIAHPPGYAFYTLLAKLWQLLMPVGTIAFRSNLLAAAVGAWTVTAVYLLVDDVQSAIGSSQCGPRLLPLAPAFAALALAAAPDLWQHAIHANAHIVSAALSVTHLWLLIRWWRTEHDVWLAVFAVTLGLAAAHHPIIAIGVPAYVLFVLAVRPRLVLRWRTVLLLAGCLLLGLSPLLYYPLRSPNVPFGPTDMSTWDGFIRHITARGLRVNLFHFGLADQPDRALVFWSLLRLQFLLPVVCLMPLGLVVLVRRAPGPALLMGGFTLSHLAFTLNTVQDVMAYLLLPFSGLAVLAGVGAKVFFDWAWRMLSSRVPITDRGLQSAVSNLLLALLLLTWPTMRAVQNLSRGISLRGFTAAEVWVDAVYNRFGGQGGRAVLLSAWEYLTPLWVHGYTQGRELDGQDVELVYVSTAIPWADAVRAHIGDGPIYVPGYRPVVRDAGFRLVADGAFYRVEAPPVKNARPTRPLDLWVDDRVHILGYDLPETTVRAGDPLALVIYQSAPDPMEGIWMPYAQLGPVEDRWTTDSRLLTTQWQPGEIIVERYELPVPFNLLPGDYPLRLGYADLTGGRAELPLSTGEKTVELDTVTVLHNAGAPAARILERSLANLDGQVALMGARVRAGGRWRRAFWDEPIIVRAGGTLHLTLNWRALASPRDSATVFIHLIDEAERPVAGWDYTPLGGSAPTYLWFPKWLPGQSFVDPYRLTLPAGLPSGNYRLEVGMYGMTSHRRLPVVHLSGDLAGDRVILGPVRVE